ncbi:MAG TPA: hypothetical protein VFM66_11745, partial [Agromyces sp.]|nr:hypothetical protein [Agromyces sp.]
MPDHRLLLIAVPQGTIELRDARSESSRTVSLQRFELGRTQITRAEYRAVLGDAGEQKVPDAAGSPDAPQHPVTWFGAVTWCNAASVALGLTPAYEVD